jgi:exosortase A-associated hydrolase 2
MEKYLFFKNIKQKNLFGVLYIPESHLLNKGITICQPIGEERNKTRRVFVNFAKLLCLAGYHVFLFDYYGEGNSEGDFEEATIETRVSDILIAIKFLLQETNVITVGLIGLRLGATLATLAAKEEENVDFVILWNPVVNGNGYFQEWLKFNLTSQVAIYREIKFNRKQLENKLMNGESIEIEGNIITNKLYEQFKKINLLENIESFSKNTLIVEMLNDISSQDQLVNQFVSVMHKNNKNLEFIIIKKSFDWNSFRIYNPEPENLFNKTLNWVRNLSISTINL